MTRIKICGIMDRTELSAALRAGADAVGFVVEVASSRHCLSAEQASRLIQQVPLFNRSVAVIAPQNLDGAVSLARGRLPGVEAVVLPLDHLGLVRRRGILASLPGDEDHPVHARISGWLGGLR